MEEKNTETKRFDIGKLKNKEVAKNDEHLIQNKLAKIAQNADIMGKMKFKTNGVE